MKTVTQQTEIMLASDHGVVTTHSVLIITSTTFKYEKKGDFMKNVDCRQYTSDLLTKQETSLCQPVMPFNRPALYYSGIIKYNM